MDTNPARSISPFISAVTSRKYTGESEDDAFCFDHFIDATVNDIVIENAMAVLVLETLHAGSTTPDLLFADLHELGLDPFVLQFLKHMPNQD